MSSSDNFYANIHFPTTYHNTINSQNSNKMLIHTYPSQQFQHEQIQSQPQSTSLLRIFLDKSMRHIKSAYDLIFLNLVVPLLSLVYFKHSTNTPLTSTHASNTTSAPSFSILIGQLFFGYLGGAYGQHKFYSLDLVIIILGTVFCALSPSNIGNSANKSSDGGAAAVIQYLTFWRFVLTFGIGGDYPISATVPSDQAVTNRRRRNQFTAILTSIQGLGNLMVSIVTLIVLIRFRAMIVNNDKDEVEERNMATVWRICIAVGCLPALSTALIRLTMSTSSQRRTSNSFSSGQTATSHWDSLETHIGKHTKNGKCNDNDIEIDNSGYEKNLGMNMLEIPNSTSYSAYRIPSQSSTPSLPRFNIPQRRDSTRIFCEYCSRWENLKVLIGTSLSWFLLDLAFRSIALNQTYLLDALGLTSSTPPSSSNAPNPTTVTPNTLAMIDRTFLYRRLWITTLGNVTVSLFGIVPGFWFAIFSIEKMRHKRTQLIGFAMITFLFTALSTMFHQLKAIVPLFITMFTLSQFFSNLNPSTPYVIPEEVFPMRVRTAAHGISAGFGKIGAVLATLIFNRLVEMESPFGENTLVSSVTTTMKKTTMTTRLIGTMILMIAFLAMVVILFPRGTRRLLMSRHVWSCPRSRCRS